MTRPERQEDEHRLRDAVRGISLMILLAVSTIAAAAVIAGLVLLAAG